MTTHRILAALALLALPACTYDAPGCTPTTTTAHRADKVYVAVVGRSSVVTATLESNAGPLDGKRLTFEVLDDSATVYTDEASTGSDGTARIDLKRADADALVAIARGDAFRASFAGDGTYCSSSGRAGFHTVRA